LPKRMFLNIIPTFCAHLTKFCARALAQCPGNLG
jgi:hypothetical protein